MARLEISSLGALQIGLEDAAVSTLKSAKARALLVYLAVEAERAHRREMLAELLWPDRPGRIALNNLRYALSRLRKAIDDQHASPCHLLVERETIQFNQASDHRLDVAELARDLPGRDCNPALLEARPALLGELARGVQAYNGRFLEGFTVESEDFNEWALLRREEIERRVLAGLRCLAEYYQSRGDYRAAERYLRRQLALEPWNEQAHGTLMEALALDGRRSAALSHFDVVRRLLQQELDVTPAPETLALVEQIRRGTLPQPAPAPPAARAQPDASPRTLPPAQPVDQTPFVDRAPQLARLEAALRQALAGHGQVQLVSGDPGSGKTMLLEELTRRACQAQPDLLVAAGSCSAQGGVGDPFLPFQTIYRTLVAALSDAAANRFAQLSQIFGAATHPPVSPTSREDLAGSLHAGLLHEALECVHTAARQRPLLLLVHRLHWADPTTLSLFFYLSQRLSTARVLLVGAFRPPAAWSRPPGRRGQGKATLAGVVDELRLGYGDVLIDLNEAGGSEFVDALVDAEPNALGPEFRRWLCDMTDGVPLFAVELLDQMRRQGQLLRDVAGRWVGQPAALAGPLPPRSEAALALHLQRLAPPALRLLEAASVCGPVFSAEVVAQAAGLAPQAAVRLLSGPLSRDERLVTPCETVQQAATILSRYRFRQGLMQQYLYRSLDEVQRAYWQQALAAAQSDP